MSPVTRSRPARQDPSPTQEIGSAQSALQPAVLNAVRRLIRPAVRLLLLSGVQYVAFAAALKQVFVETARAELRRSGLKATDSAISVLSGVHRKDVRQLQSPTGSEPQATAPSPASKALTLWMTEPRYCDRRGRPRTLPRTGAAVSFDTLARQVSTDVHPRTLLEELARRGLVLITGDTVKPVGESFVPSDDMNELMALFADNAHDHLSAAVNNLTTDRPLLEQSVFAYGLSEESVRELGVIAREVWAQAFQRMASEATLRYERDRNSGASGRMRFGVYFFEEPQDASKETKDEA